MPNTYGDSGNRWWAAYNTSQSLFSANLYSPSGYESLPSGDARDDAEFARAAKKTAALKTPYPAGKGPVISVDNVNWANVNGPYPSQSAANTQVAALQKAAPAPGTGQQVVNQAKATAKSGLGIGGLNGTNLAVRAVKIIAGAVIMIVGLAKIAGISNATVAKAVKVAPFL